MSAWLGSKRAANSGAKPMSDDPVRLLDEGGSELVRTLLSAAREEEPGDAAMRRTLAAVGVGVALKAAASASATSATTAAASTASTAAGTVAAGSVTSAAVPTVFIVGKWLAVGIVAGAVASTTVYGVSGAFSPAPRVAPSARELAPVPPPEIPPAPRPAREARAEPILPALVPSASNAVSALAPPAAPAESAKAGPADSLAQEVATLDGARQALAGGNASGALAALNGYERRFPAASMLPEALYLRLQAFTLKGDRTSAESVARQILQRYPASPHAAHARAVLGSAAP